MAENRYPATVKPGFKHPDDFGNPVTVRFIELEGRDKRWLVRLYYAPCRAIVKIFSTKAEYERFIANFSPLCYQSYQEFRIHMEL